MTIKGPTVKRQVCCGSRIRARLIEGQLVEQPHECQKSEDVTGIDWKAVKAEQESRIEERA